ncbi:hypothetical protein P7C70_g7620, partial [Phenoliferia sp. Uapishka_3]
MATKVALKRLLEVFTTPSASPTPTFPSLSLPQDLSDLVNSHLTHFAASFPLGGGGGHQVQVELSRERTRWREGLLEIWAAVEPLPGTEGEPIVIARVSAFLGLLEKLSSSVGEDEESALVSRKEVGEIWWSAVLRRVMLGTAKEGGAGAGAGEGKGKERGRRGTPKWIKESLTSGVGGGSGEKEKGSTLRPLTVSRKALGDATKMMSWGMARSDDDGGGEKRLTVFGRIVWEEFMDRAVAMLKGKDEGYGVRNLEEAIIGWADKAPETFFAHLAPLLSPTPSPSPTPTPSQTPSPPPSPPPRLPILSLLLLYLTRYPSKSVYALRTPLLNSLNQLCLSSPSPAMVTISIKCLAVFLVTLPVIIGVEVLMGVFAVYGKVVTWERVGESGEGGTRLDASEDQGFEEASFDGPPPDPMVLFTVLYGTYPCNFTAFLRDPLGYLRSKNYQFPNSDNISDSGFGSLDSNAIKYRSAPLIRQHTLHPSLFTLDLSTELTDTNRFRSLEAADIMAECDRNVVHVAESFDIRDPTPALLAHAVRSSSINFLPQPQPQSGRSNAQRSPIQSRATSRSRVEEEGEGGERAITPTPLSPTLPSSPSRSRSRPPLMPHTTHYSNFQALQGSSTSITPSVSHSNSPTRQRSSSPFSRFLPPNYSQDSSNTSSRRSSYVGTMPGSMMGSKMTSGTGGLGGVGASQLVRLETELLVLQGEVNFQTYLKGLHLAHMGTLHREKVLDSGAEAERQSLYRTIRTLRAQLKQTKTSLDKLRAESGVTKANWIVHIDDLKDKLRTFREQRIKWDAEGGALRAEVEELKKLVGKQAKELEAEGAELFDLQNQVTVDSAKLARIEEYEARIEALTKTLSICDEDLCKFTEQRRDMDKLVGEWKKSEMLREAAESELSDLKATVRSVFYTLISHLPH